MIEQMAAVEQERERQLLLREDNETPTVHDLKMMFPDLVNLDDTFKGGSDA